MLPRWSCSRRPRDTALRIPPGPASSRPTIRSRRAAEPHTLSCDRRSLARGSCFLASQHRSDYIGPGVGHKVTSVTRIVMLVSSGRSRARAACHASWPTPASPQSASTGIAAPTAMLTETPATASNCGPASGITCQNRMRSSLRPLARAVMMCGREYAFASRLRA